MLDVTESPISFVATILAYTVLPVVSMKGAATRVVNCTEHCCEAKITELVPLQSEVRLYVTRSLCRMYILYDLIGEPLAEIGAVH